MSNAFHVLYEDDFDVCEVEQTLRIELSKDQPIPRVVNEALALLHSTPYWKDYDLILANILSWWRKPYFQNSEHLLEAVRSISLNDEYACLTKMLSLEHKGFVDEQHVILAIQNLFGASLDNLSITNNKSTIFHTLAKCGKIDAMITIDNYNQSAFLKAIVFAKNHYNCSPLELAEEFSNVSFIAFAMKMTANLMWYTQTEVNAISNALCNILSDQKNQKDIQNIIISVRDIMTGLNACWPLTLGYAVYHTALPLIGKRLDLDINCLRNNNFAILHSLNSLRSGAQKNGATREIDLKLTPI